MLDFTDLLTMTRRALQASSRLRNMYAETRTRHLIIDEFQDFTPINYELLLLMRGPTHSVTIAVDPNQSIYSWRGASPELVERFRYDFPGAQECGLSMNHRTASSVMRTWREMATNPDMTGLVDDYQRALRPAKKPTGGSSGRRAGRSRIHRNREPHQQADAGGHGTSRRTSQSWCARGDVCRPSARSWTGADSPTTCWERRAGRATRTANRFAQC